MDSNKEVLSLGQLVSKLRKEKGFSQRKFAQISGLSNTTISRIENGETVHPDIETLKLLAAHLDYSESKLIDLVDASKNHNITKRHVKLKFLQQPVRGIKRYSSVGTTIPTAEPEQSMEPEQLQPKNYKFSDEVIDVVDIQADKRIALKGMHLITLRMEKNITQKELADALGLDKTLISQYEGEIIKPEYSTVSRLADFFGVTIDYLSGEAKPEKSYEEAHKEPVYKEIRLKALQKREISPEYLTIAEEIQDAGIEIEDVRAFIDMLKKYRR